MLAVGSNELGEPVKKGDVITNGEYTGTVEYGTDLDGNEDDMLGFIRTDDGSYLVAVNGRLLNDWRII